MIAGSFLSPDQLLVKKARTVAVCKSRLIDVCMFFAAKTRTFGATDAEGIGAEREGGAPLNLHSAR